MEHIKKANIFRNRDPVERAAIQKFLAILKSKKLKETELLSNQQALFQQFKLNHGLFLNGCRIEPSKQAVLIEGDKWNINLYEGQPFVYTSVNDHTSHVNLLSFNSDDDDVELDESLQPSDLYSISNAQKYLRNTYPTKKEREKVTRLIINKKKLEYHLDLSDFVNLEKLNCSENELTSLDISKNKQLTEIDCSQNKLISLDLSNCLNIKLVTANCNQLNELKLPVSNDLKLEYLNLLDNSFSQNLDCFNQLFNLKELLIGNIDGDRIQLGIYNQFHGSLKPLKNLIKLESLSINNTDIEFGLEFLPDSIKNFRCLADQRAEAKVKKIYEQLEEYTLSPIEAFQGKYNLKAWRKNWKLVKEKEALQNQFKQVEELTSSAKLKEFEKEESSLIAEEEDLLVKNKSLEQERKNLEQETDDLKQLVKELNAKLEQKEVDYQQAKQQLEEKEEMLKSFTEEKLENFTTEKLMVKEELNKEIKVLKYELLIKERDTEQSKKHLEEMNKELKIKEEESIKAREIENELEEVKRNKNRLQNEKVQQQSIVEYLQKEQTILRDNIKNLDTKLRDKVGFINNLEQQSSQQIEELQSKLDEEIRKYQISQEINTSLNDELKNKEKIIKESQNKLNEETRKYQDSLDKLKNKEELNKELESKLDEGIRKYQVSQEIITSLNNELKNKEKIIEKSQNKLNEEIRKYQDSLDKLKNNEEFIKELQIRLDKEVKKDQAFQKIITSLNSELKNKEKIIKESQNKLNEEIEIITSFNSELKNKENIIEELLFRNF
ncbi:18913_t:CDS:2 [Rhizophagus irregularis]|nr:18913_t:CDS:2 [Rhizophagus irregularis]